MEIAQLEMLEESAAHNRKEASLDARMPLLNLSAFQPQATSQV